MLSLFVADDKKGQEDIGQGQAEIMVLDTIF
jgi:hypothetical protein